MEEVIIRVERNTLGEAKPEVLARVKMMDYHHDTDKFNVDCQAVIEALRTAVRCAECLNYCLAIYVKLVCVMVVVHHLDSR